MGFPGGSDGKESACDARDLGSIPGLGRFPGEGNGNLLQFFWLENPHGQRSLAGYSPWSHKELDTTEELALSLLTGSETTYILCEQRRVGMSVFFRGSTAPSGIVQHGKLRWGEAVNTANRYCQSYAFKVLPLY